MLKAILAISLLFAAYAVDNAAAQSQPKPHQVTVQAPSPPSATAPAPDQRGTDKIPLTVKILPSPDAQAQAEKEDRERQDSAQTEKRLATDTARLADYTNWLVIVTGFLFGAALLQIGLFWVQLNLIKRSLAPAIEAAGAAKQAAKAAEETIKTMKAADANQERLARVHERAYVFGGPGERRRNIQKRTGAYSDHVVEIVTITGVVFTIGNYGRTPGFVTRVEWGRCGPDDWTTKLAHESPMRFDHTVEYGAVLFPGAHLVEQPRIEYATEGDTADHVFYGRIVYTDVFKEEHHSVWRHIMHWNPELNPPDWEPRALPGNNTEWD